MSENPKIFNIDTKVAGIQLMLALEEDPDKTESFDQIATFCDWYEGVLIKTTRGLAYPTKTKVALLFCLNLNFLILNLNFDTFFVLGHRSSCIVFFHLWLGGVAFTA